MLCYNRDAQHLSKMVGTTRPKLRNVSVEAIEVRGADAVSYEVEVKIDVKVEGYVKEVSTSLDS